MANVPAFEYTVHNGDPENPHTLRTIPESEFIDEFPRFHDMMNGMKGITLDMVSGFTMVIKRVFISTMRCPECLCRDVFEIDNLHTLWGCNACGHVGDGAIFDEQEACQ